MICRMMRLRRMRRARSGIGQEGSVDFAGHRAGAHGRRLVSHHQLEFAIQSADRVIGLRAGRMTDCPGAAFVQTDHRMIFVT
jgi:hypothetical protein